MGKRVLKAKLATWKGWPPTSPGGRASGRSPWAACSRRWCPWWRWRSSWAPPASSAGPRTGPGSSPAGPGLSSGPSGLFHFSSQTTCISFHHMSLMRYGSYFINLKKKIGNIWIQVQVCYCQFVTVWNVFRSGVPCLWLTYPDPAIFVNGINVFLLFLLDRRVRIRNTCCRR